MEELKAMPTSTAAMQAAYRRAPSLETARAILLRELSARPDQELTIMSIVSSTPEWAQARDALDAAPDPLVTRMQLLDAFLNRLGAAARLLAGTAVRSGPQEIPKIRLVGRRKWRILPSYVQAAAPHPDLAAAAELPPEILDLHFQGGPAPGQPPPVAPEPLLSGPGMPIMRDDNDPADPINRVMDAASAAAKQADRSARDAIRNGTLPWTPGQHFATAAGIPPEEIAQMIKDGTITGGPQESLETDPGAPGAGSTRWTRARTTIVDAIAALSEAVFSGASRHDALILTALRASLKAARLLGMGDSQIASYVSDGVVLSFGPPDRIDTYSSEELNAADRTAQRGDSMK